MDIISVFIIAFFSDLPSGFTEFLQNVREFKDRFGQIHQSFSTQKIERENRNLAWNFIPLNLMFFQQNQAGSEFSLWGRRPPNPDLLLMSKSRQKDIPQTPERLGANLKNWLLAKCSGKCQFVPYHRQHWL